MSFKFYTNMLSQASRGLAASTFIVGLLLIGFGILIIALPEFFALLASLVFFIAGIGCIGTGIKIFMSLRNVFRSARHGEDVHRVNVRIHREEEDFDL